MCSGRLYEDAHRTVTREGSITSLHACHVCGLPGEVARFDDRCRAIFWCRTGNCDVVEYDRDLIRRRAGLPEIPSMPRRIRVRRAQP